METLQVNSSDQLNTVSSNDTLITVYESDFTEKCLDTFDRVVSDLPSYYAYCAYALDDSSMILITGSTYSVSGSSLYFGDDAKALLLTENDSSILLDGYSVPGYGIVVESSKIYYTNMISGYPSLGDHHLNFTSFACLGLLCCVLGSILSRSSRR